MPRELELKLLVRPARLARLQQALSAISAPQRQLLETHYFDCDDGRGGYLLRSLAAALRVRVIGDKRVQTLKTAGAIHAGMLSRGEWETEVTGDAPDLAQLETDFPADAALAALIAALRDKPPPRHIFTTRFERDAYSVTTQTGVVEAALDSGEVVAGERAARICELELELVRGEPVAIFDLAVTLSRTTPFSIGLVSKAERGYALLGRSRLPPPAKAQRPALLPAMTVEDAFAAILLAGLSQLIANLDGFLHRRDPEYLHQMRVATRRIRAALSLFARALPRASLAGAARATASYGRLLGEARNWDVLVSELLPQMAQVLPSETGLLRNQVRQQARGARAAARRALRDRRYTQFLLGFAALVVGRRWRDAASESALEALAQIGQSGSRDSRRRRRRAPCSANRGEKAALLRRVFFQPAARQGMRRLRRRAFRAAGRARPRQRSGDRQRALHRAARADGRCGRARRRDRVPRLDRFGCCGKSAPDRQGVAQVRTARGAAHTQASRSRHIGGIKWIQVMQIREMRA